MDNWSKLLKKILQLPKLNKIERAPPLLQINKAISDIESNVDWSSLDINEQTKDLDVIKSEIKIDEVSDFQLSEDFDSDENLDDIKTYMNMIKDIKNYEI